MSLAIGMAGAILVFLFVRFELSFDQYHKNKDRIFRLVTEIEGGAYDGIAKVNGPWGPAAKREIPEVEEVTRFVPATRTLMAHDDRRNYEQEGFFADPSALTMFDFPLLRGDRGTALSAPHTIVMTKELAERYFGSEDPVGKTITIDGTTGFTVTGLLGDVPMNSHFRFEFLLSMASLDHPDRDNWIRWNQFYTYLLLKKGSAPGDVASKFAGVLKEHIGAQAEHYAPFLQPMTAIHLHSELFREIAATGSIAEVYGMMAIAVSLLLIGCVNFTNLTTARVSKRTREIGIRKVTGATVGVLTLQVLSEALLMSSLALVVACVLARIALPLFNGYLGTALTIHWFSDPVLAVGLALITLLVALLSGMYPAFVLSALRPTEVLKGEWRGSRGQGIRKALVVFQFAVSVFFLVGAGIVRDQMEFVTNRRLGFDKEQLVVVPIAPGEARGKLDVLRNRLLEDPSIERVSITATMPGGLDFGVPFVPEGFSPGTVPPSRIMAVDQDFVPTFRMSIVQGRNFSREMAGDTTGYLINKQAAKEFGWKNPIGKRIAMPAIGRPAGPVIGVVKDFNYRSLHQRIWPLIMFVPDRTWFSTAVVRIVPARTKEALEHIHRVFSSLDPVHPANPSFFDETFNRLYTNERQLKDVLNFFTVLTIVIAGLGLFGLSTFSAEQRRKEVGIRKVLGGSAPGIVGLLSKDFLVLVGIAIVVAWPCAYLAGRWWLDSFAYRTSIALWTFVLAGIAALLIAFLTISVQSIRAALANPVETLRYE